jgi:hypothetical protein
MEVSIRGEMTVQFETVNPATLELEKNKVIPSAPRAVE